MIAGPQCHLPYGGGDTRIFFQHEEFVRRQVQRRQKIERQIKLVPAIVERQRPQQACQAIGQRRPARQARIAPQNLRRQPHHGTAGGIEIGFQNREIGEMLGGRVERPGRDNRFEIWRRQMAVGKQRRQSSHHRMIAGRALRRTLNRLAPPLQPDRPQHRLAHTFGHMRHFVIEGIKRVEIGPMLAGANSVAK